MFQKLRIIFLNNQNGLQTGEDDDGEMLPTDKDGEGVESLPDEYPQSDDGEMEEDELETCWWQLMDNGTELFRIFDFI